MLFTSEGSSVKTTFDYFFSYIVIGIIYNFVTLLYTVHSMHVLGSSTKAVESMILRGPLFHQDSAHNSHKLRMVIPSDP